MQLHGIHHVTAVSADIRSNHTFYTETLGMRLVKRSVNQDDVTAYHLFYADGAGTPGTDLTFFDWSVPPETRGTRSIIRTGLCVDGERSIEWWARRLRDSGVASRDAREIDGRLTIEFEDAEGQRLAIVDDSGTEGFQAWERSTVPHEHQIRGLGAVTLSVPRLAPTEIVLLEVLGMEKMREYGAPDGSADAVHVYRMGGSGAPAELHLRVQPNAPTVRPGAGGVHHVALRTPTFAEYDAWIERLAEVGLPNSGPVDRFWFRSLYFREPNGILFEIATDGPGFAVDEDADALGEKLVLPPFLEPRRAAIAAGLKPID